MDIALENLKQAHIKYDKALYDYQLVEISFDLGERVEVCVVKYPALIGANTSTLYKSGKIIKVNNEYFYDVEMDEKNLGVLKEIRYDFLKRLNSNG